MSSQPAHNETISKHDKLFVRAAKVEEFPEIVAFLSDAFIHDPVMSYFGNVKKLVEPGTREKENLELCISWLLRSCHAVGGRITVVADPSSSESETSEETIAAAAFWLPPNVRLSLRMVAILVRCGVLKMLRRWGLSGFLRIGFEYPEKSHSAMEKGYKERGVKESPDASWYLQLVGTAAAYQGRGCMTMLLREAYAHAPTCTFTLEATTTKSRDQYQHLGFDLISSVILGKGKADAAGLASTGKQAVGVETYAMRSPGK